MQLTMYNAKNEKIRSIQPGELVSVKAEIYDCNGT
jgi:hypothetical protein